MLFRIMINARSFFEETGCDAVGCEPSTCVGRADQICIVHARQADDVLYLSLDSQMQKHFFLINGSFTFGKLKT